MGTVLALLALAAGSFFLESFFVMLFWGSIASWFDAPTISYVQSLTITLFISVIQLFGYSASQAKI